MANNDNDCANNACDLAASDLLLLPSSDKLDDYDYYFIVINNDNDCANNDREIFKCPLGEIQLI